MSFTSLFTREEEKGAGPTPQKLAWHSQLGRVTLLLDINHLTENNLRQASSETVMG